MTTPKGNMHVSKHNPFTNPTGSTFGLHSTATKVSNINGNIFYNMSHSRHGEARDFGYPREFVTQNGKVANSIECQTKHVKLPKIRSTTHQPPPPNKFKDTKSQMTLKPILPTQQPVHGLTTKVDYLSGNKDIARSLSRKRGTPLPCTNSNKKKQIWYRLEAHQPLI